MTQNRKMKFWQLVSMFRNDLPALVRVLGEDEWKSYSHWLGEFNELVRSQNRQILDTVLPEKLVINALNASKLIFLVNDSVLRLSIERKGSENQFTALEVYKRYGAEAIEEALEYGSWLIAKEY
jgi:hypothetical protein